jgi:hypothetical protein
VITIVEGPDGAGKTTLVDDLYFRAGGMVGRLHQGPYYNDVLKETLTTVSRAMERDAHILCDRLHLGERIYGPVFREADMLKDRGQRVLERALLGLGEVVQVICYPPYDPHVKEAWLAREQIEMLESLGQLERVYRLYKTQWSMLPTVSYDWTQQSVDWLVEEMEAIRSPANPGPGVGWYGSDKEGTVLIVGERCNPLKVGTQLPFVSVEGSSGWMSDQIPDIDERQLYWINALTPDGQPEHPGFIEEMQPKGIIALGSVASTWLREAGYTHERIDHPSYHRRFRNGETYPLQETIHAIRS